MAGDGTRGAARDDPFAPAIPRGFFVIAGVGSAILLVLDLRNPAPTVHALRVLVAAVAAIAYPLAARWPRATLHAVLCAAATATLGIGYLGGAIYYAALLPLIAGHFAGSRAAVLWSLLVAVGIFAAPRIDPLVPDEIFITPPRRAIGDVVFVGITLAIAIASRRRHVAQLEAIRARQLELERANTQLAELNEQTARARDDAEAASRERTALLSRMSHEVRTPLAAIQGIVELLREEPLPPQARDLVTSVDSSASALRRLVDDMLDLARIGAGRLTVERTPTDVRAVLEDTVDLFVGASTARGLELSARIDPKVPRRVSGDAPRLSQMLANLVGNALRFTSEGAVTLEARWEPSATNGELVISVADTGPGIAPERLARLFRPFEQGGDDVYKRYGGSGLGLSLVDELARAMGGSVSVESALGRGSRFVLRLPGIEVEASLDEPTLSMPAGSSGPRARLALVEPHEATRDAAVATLAAIGCEVTAVASVDELREKLGRSVLAGVIVGASRALDPEAAARALEIVLPGVPRVLAIGPGNTPAAQHLLARRAFDTTTLRPLRRARLIAVLDDLATRASTPHAVPLVLVVDDDPVNRRLTSTLVGRAGARVEMVADGPAALSRLSRGDVHLALLDLNLPGMDGAAVAEAVTRALPPAVRPRMIALTASSLPADRERCLAAGMDGYLVRPVAVGTITDLVEESARRLRRQNARSSGSALRPETVSMEATVVTELTTRDATLDELAALFGATEARDVVGEYRASATELVAELERALSSGERATAHRVAHTLKSSSGSMGALEVSRLAAAMESVLRDAPSVEASGARPQLAALKSAVERADAWLAAWLAKPA